MEGPMGWQPGPGDAAGASPPPQRGPGTSGGAAARDPRLAAFASADGLGGPAPSGALALLADQVSGPGRRCPGATSNELVGLLRGWAAVESWAAAAKLGVIAELVRRDDTPPGTSRHGDLPDAWSASLRHELAAALSCSAQSAETTAWLAWEQQARLPGIRALLDDGTLTFAKARAVIETFRYLSDADAARAEALILDQLAGKTYPQVVRLAEQAALTVDPDLAARRREQAQKKDARVLLFREQPGTAGLCGRDLPPDEALAAMASVNARAQEYQDSGAFGDTRTDVLRAYGYLDLLNGITAEARIACAQAQDEAADAAEALAWAEARAARNTAGAQSGAGSAEEPWSGDAQAGPRDCPCDSPCDSPCGKCDGSCPHGHGGAAHAGDTPRSRDEDTAAEPSNCGGGRDEDTGEPGGRGYDGDDDEPGGGSEPGDGDGGGDGPGPAGPGPGPGVSPAGRAIQLRPPDLVVPLATLLGLAGRPGEIQGFGPLDPALARQLAAAAAADPRTEVCVTVTSPEGYAIGHGCARAERTGKAARAPDASLIGFPARLNLTIPVTTMASLANHPRHIGPWGLSPRGSPGPPGRESLPDDYGSWTLTIPGGLRFTVRLDPVPVLDCDHRYESRGYQPSDRLRHLVQVRDGACTFPPCARHARESDFEHARPYDKGGKTCACKCDARSHMLRVNSQIGGLACRPAA
jgi:hypothetical protein